MVAKHLSTESLPKFKFRKEFELKNETLMSLCTILLEKFTKFQKCNASIDIIYPEELEELEEVEWCLLLLPGDDFLAGERLGDLLFGGDLDLLGDLPLGERDLLGDLLIGDLLGLLDLLRLGGEFLRPNPPPLKGDLGLPPPINI